MTRPLLAMALDTLQERVEEASRDSLVAAFAAWLGVRPPVSGESPPAHTGPPRYQDVALAGLTAAIGNDTAAFKEGLVWLKGRKFFRPNRTPGLEGDPLALLVIAIGIATAEPKDSACRAWVTNFSRQAAQMESDEWRRAVLTAATALTSGSGWEALPADLLVALESKDLFQSSLDTREQALRLVMENIRSEPDERAVVRFAALKRLLSIEASIDLHKLAIRDAVGLLRDVPAALKRWPWMAPRSRKPAQTWDLQSEYDVQALLWALFRPVFSDLVDEEYLKSLGYKHPRVDLAIPSLRLIIEVKYLYEATQGALGQIEEAVAADTGLYLSTDNGYDAIIAFVWDSTASVQHHAALERGLRKLNGVVDAVVVARPGGWKLPPQPP